MIVEQIAYKVYKCFECDALLVRKFASEGPPGVCERCGTPSGVELTQEQRVQMERIRSSGNNGGGYTIRFG